MDFPVLCLSAVSHFENRAALGTVSIPLRKVLAVILRVPRVESRSSFFNTQKLALIESMNLQSRD
jgi:hypothetical protein